MPKLRVGVVSFLNAQPLWVALKGDPEIELLPDTPARLSEMMAAGELDLGLLPAIEALRIPEVEIVRELGVAAEGAVESVGIFTRLDEGDTVAANSMRFDARSRTSVALAKIVLKALDIEPEVKIAEVRPELFDKYTESGLLLIGDDCLRARALWPKWRFLDLGKAWHEWTGLPFTYAIWTAKHGVLTHALRRKLNDALENGRAAVPRLVSIAREVTMQSEAWLENYLTKIIQHRLDKRCIKGLREFARRAEEIGLLPEGSSAKLSHEP